MTVQSKMKLTTVAIIGTIALFFFLIFMGCKDAYPSNPKYETIEIDGCEYIQVQGGVGSTYYYSLTHKGNCKNPIHPTSSVVTIENIGGIPSDTIK